MAFMAQRFDVRNHGAKGDAQLNVSGSGNDDALAITTTVALATASKLPAEIYFPPGIYRFSKPNNELYIPSGNVYDGTATNFAAMFFNNVNDLTITFAPNAILIMETDTPAGAIAFAGNCRNITLDSVDIRYATEQKDNKPAVAFYGNGSSIMDIEIINGLKVKWTSFDALLFIGCNNVRADIISIDHCKSNFNQCNGITFYTTYDVKIGTVEAFDVNGHAIFFSGGVGTANAVASKDPTLATKLFNGHQNSNIVIDKVMGRLVAGHSVQIYGGYDIHIGSVISSSGTLEAVGIYSSSGVDSEAPLIVYPASRRIKIGSIDTDNALGLLVTSKTAGREIGGFGSDMDTTSSPPIGAYLRDSTDYHSSDFWYHDISIGNINCRNIKAASDANAIYVNMVAGLSIGDISVTCDPGAAEGIYMSSVMFRSVMNLSLGKVTIMADGSTNQCPNGFHLDAFTGKTGTPDEMKLFNKISIESIYANGCQSANSCPGSVRLIGIRGGDIGKITIIDAAFSGTYINCIDTDFDIRIINPNRGDSSTTKLNAALQILGSRLRARLAVHYEKVGPTPNLIAIFNPGNAVDCHIYNYQLVSDSLSNGAVNFSGKFSTVIGAWFNTGQGTRGGVAYGLGNYTTPFLLSGDNGQVGQLSIDTNGNLRLTQVSPGTQYPIISTTGSVIS